MIQSRPQLDYYSQRLRQERAAAERTTDEMARRVHRELAERYTALLGETPIAI